MRDAGFTPSPVDFRSLMVCHRNFEEQRRIYETMRKEHPTAKLPEAWAVLLRNAVLNGEPHAVDWLRQEMQDMGWSVQTNTVVFLAEQIWDHNWWMISNTDVQ